MRNHDFDRPPAIVSDRRKRKHEQAPHVGGFFYTGLTVELQESLVEYVRHAAADARDAGRQALVAQDAEKLARREERVITLLNKHIEQYAYAMELFEAWEEEGGQRVRSCAAIKVALLDANGRQKPESQQLEWLRYQIEMRVLGLGWTQYATRWSSSKDSRIGTVAHLQVVGIPCPPAPTHHIPRSHPIPSHPVPSHPIPHHPRRYWRSWLKRSSHGRASRRAPTRVCRQRRRPRRDSGATQRSWAHWTRTHSRYGR